jgi:hypothetical protein
MGLVNDLRRRPSRGLLAAADAWVRHARDYLSVCGQDRSGPEEAAKHHPAIAAAAKLMAEESPSGREVVEGLQILVLGDCPRSEIAERLELSVEAVEAWEALYFDVREARQAVDWVHRHVILPAEQDGNTGLAARLRLASNGPAAACSIFDAGTNAPFREGQRLFDRKVRLALKFEEAAQLSLDSEARKLTYMKLHAQLQGREQHLAYLERKLEQRSRDATFRWRQAEARLRAAERRAERERERAEERRLEREARERKAREQRIRVLRHEQEVSRRKTLRDEQIRRAKAQAATSALARLTWATSEGPVVTTPAGTLHQQASRTRNRRRFHAASGKRSSKKAGSEV